MDYQEFLKSKQFVIQTTGIDVEPQKINPMLFDFQRDIVLWALKKGRAAIFAGCGLGKTFMQLEWSRHVSECAGGMVLIFAPLSVAAQTVDEGQKLGVNVALCRTQDDCQPGINITNYEMLEHFDLSQFVGLVLDESSILKSYSGVFRNRIIELSRNISYLLACTATPAPNDYMELGNHSEFLGVMTRSEMLSMFFVHDGGDTSKWRLKGHAVKRYWEWVASWSVMLQKPSDLGYSDEGFELPPLRVHQVTIESGEVPEGLLFAIAAETLQERQRARAATVKERSEACAKIVNVSNEPWVIWCNLNSESEELTKRIIGAVEIRGSHSSEYKEAKMNEFTAGEFLKLVTKPSIAGFGMNWQHACKMAFVGLSDSFEEYYQAVRREWRFGQKNPVDVYVITTELEGAVVDNIKRKERDFEAMLNGMISATQEITKANIKNTQRETTDYNPQVEMVLPSWLKEVA
jgi:superfamily II DNA or RNA helicase